MTFSVRGFDGLARMGEAQYAAALAALPAEYARRGLYALDRIADRTSTMVIALGERLAPQLAPHAPILVDAMARTAEDARKAPLSFVALDTITLVAACAGAGGAVPAQAFDDARTALSAITTNRQDEHVHYHWQRGLTAIALAWPQVYRGLLGLAGEPTLPFTPGERFAGNLHGFLRHLAGACEHGATPADVLPAWDELLHEYGALSGAKMVSADCLFWAAWIIHVRLAHQPIADFDDALHETLYRAAGVTP